MFTLLLFAFFSIGFYFFPPRLLFHLAPSLICLHSKFLPFLSFILSAQSDPHKDCPNPHTPFPKHRPGYYRGQYLSYYSFVSELLRIIDEQGEEYHGLTPLHLAIAYGNDELAEVFFPCLSYCLWQHWRAC